MSTMQEDAVKQWSNLTKAALDSFKQMYETNVATTNSLLSTQFNLNSWAELMKYSMASAKELQEMNTNIVNDILKNQLQHVNLKASASAVKEFGEIGSNAMGELMRQQTDLINEYMEKTAEHLESVKDAKNAEEVVNAQARLFAELQEKMKASTVSTMGLLGQVKTAMSTWTEKNIETLSESTKQS